VVERALAAGKAVHVFAGEITGSSTKGRKLSAHAITPSGTPLQRALQDARVNLAAAVDRVFG
jgi:hypothetical protein